MLGRQQFRAGRRYGKDVLLGNAAANILKKHRPDVAVDECLQDDGYAEAMFRSLGFGDVESLDFSDFEGAQLLCDLNQPVPEEWHGQFDFIFDGGTLEHVFNVPQALRNMFDMLSPNGRFVALNPLNNWVGHGLYQFSPELVYAFWNRACGCKVHRCIAMNDSGSFTIDLQDIATDGMRREMKTTWHGRSGLPPTRLFLWYEVERLPTSVPQGIAMQNDYERRWEDTQLATGEVAGPRSKPVAAEVE